MSNLFRTRLLNTGFCALALSLYAGHARAQETETVVVTGAAYAYAAAT